MDFQSRLAFSVGVLLCCALQKSAIQQPASLNCTCDGQRISFNHSYKINLPMMKVEADPLQRKGSGEVQLDPGEAKESNKQIIIFRHNIHVHAPKGNCENLTIIMDLLERIEKLEKEVAELREVCSPWRCCGGGNQEIDPPKNLSVLDVTHSTGVVTWTPPAAQIDGYTLTYQDQDGVSKKVQLGPSEQRFMLEGLEQGVRYTIFVMAYKGDCQSRKTNTTFSTVSFLYPYPADCRQMQQNGNASSGVYTIYLNGDGSRPMQVYCDMATDGGGWIVFQRRSTGEVDFYKRWNDYVKGFGDLTGEFWLGLDKLHSLTSRSPIRYELRVDLRTASESVYAVYGFFWVASSRERYRLSVGNYRGNAGDAMTYHNGWKFTTWDRDNDVAPSNCALTHHGAWWYKNDHLANLNGKYGESKHSEGVNWEPWKGYEFSIPFTEMKIRPQSCSNEPVLERKKTRF